MKKSIYVILAVFATLLLTFTGCVTKLPTDGIPMPGGYSEDRTPDDEEIAIFEAVLAGQVGNTYETTLVATQVVAGVNYRFTATATPVVPDGKPVDVYVYIYAPLTGDPELVEIVPTGD